MSKVASALKTLLLGGFFGLFSAQAVPVVFTGQIDIQPSQSYFIEFGVGDSNPEPTFYSLFWDGLSKLSDESGNFDSVLNTGPGLWTFIFTHDVIGATFDLDFSQNFEKQEQALFFELVPPDPSVIVTPNGGTSVSITGFNPNNSYLANILATDPFVGTLAINAAVGGAPELDPRSSSLPALFVFGALLATRRRGGAVPVSSYR